MRLTNRSLPNYLEQQACLSRLDDARRKSEMLTARRMTERGYELRGNNLAIQDMTDPEVLLVGAAGTGKTLAILDKINRCMWQYPHSRALIVRKVRADLAESILVTFERDVLGFDNPICAGIQRENRKVYRYPNGSEIVAGGMDRPGRILSTEYDLIYPAEAVQFEEGDWETFVMRNRNYRMPYQQVLGDTNPDRPDHWLKQRCDGGLTKLLNSYHKDNPSYWDIELGDWTPRGKDYVLGKLARLTGVRKLRYLDGKWVIAEGAVYEDWNEPVHVIENFEIPHDWKRFRSIDFGYVNPFTCQWWAVDGDGNMYLYREIYKTRRLVEEHAVDIVRLSQGESIAYTVCDTDAEDRNTLRKYGVPNVTADKAISTGLQAVQTRMKVQGNGKPRIFLLRDTLVERDQELADAKKPTCLREEIPGYVWANKSKKEEPVKEDDHGCDAMRYAAMALESGGTHSVKVRDWWN